jgi:hypothetical protein
MIFIDGPEKAGKSTLAAKIAEQHGGRVRHWGLPERPPEPFDLIYDRALREDCHPGTGGVTWDRGWASEAVYSRLLGRPGRRLADDPWLGEWLYGRMAAVLGPRVILLGPDEATLTGLRANDDLPVDVHEEREAFREYGEQWGWLVVENKHTDVSASILASRLVAAEAHVLRNALSRGISGPRYVGPVHARVLVVGDELSSLGWLPFTSPYTTRFGRALGEEALLAGWTNIGGVPEARLDDFEGVVACGSRASGWVEPHVSERKLLRVPHPSWLYRWGKARKEVERAEGRVRDFLGTKVA